MPRLTFAALDVSARAILVGGRIFGVGVTTGVALLVVAEIIREVLSFSVPLPLVIVIVLLLRLGLQAGQLRAHYLWIAGACVVFVALGRLSVPLHVRALEFDLLMALGVSTAAIGDHRVLHRALTGTYAR